MDTREPAFAFTSMEPLSFLEGDDELVTVGEPIFDVVHVEATDSLTLKVRFEDGLEGRVQFDPSRFRGVFSKLRDPDYFALVGISNGTVSWPNEDPDLSPDTMYDAIKRGGIYKLN